MLMSTKISNDYALLSSCLEHSVDSVVITDVSGIIIFVNNAFLEVTGYSYDEVLGKNSQLLMSSRTNPSIYKDISKVVSSGGVWSGQLFSTRKNQETFCVKASIFGKRNEDGQLTHVVYSTSNISVQKNLEELLLAGRDTFERLFYVSPDSVNINEYPSGKFLMVNSGFVVNMGYTEDEVLTKKPSDFSMWANNSERESFKEKLERNGTVSNFRALFRTKAGLVRTSLVSSALVDIDGKVHTINITRDITDIEETERKLANTIEKLAKTLQGTVQAISQVVEMRDPYTSEHQNDVATLAADIGQRLGLNADEIEELKMAGLLHDIGKMAIPADILTRPRRLSEIEYELVKVHVKAGYDALLNSGLSDSIKLGVYQHHERMDGSGYPQGLSGDQITLFGKILAVADTFHAMSSHRPYRASLGTETALVELMKFRGKKYDSKVVDICFEIFSEK